MNLTLEYADGLAAFERAIRNQVAPADDCDIIEWLEKNVPKIPYSPNNGPFRRESAPWLIDPLRACVDPEVRMVQILACIQAGKSMLLEFLTAHILAREPGPTLALQDKDENAKDWSESRLHQLWSVMPAVVDKIGRDEKMPAYSMRFPHMTLWSLGAFNERNLQRRSIKWLLADEYWLYPKGHIAEALGRLTAYEGLSKAVLASQGGLEGDEGHDLWKTTTQKEYGFNCPSCGGENIWTESGIIFPPEARMRDGNWHIPNLRAGVKFGCKHCPTTWADTNESRALLNGDDCRTYIQTNNDADPRKQGFRWRAVAARSWADQAEKIVRARRIYDETGDDTQRRIHKQKQEADFWADAPDTGIFSAPMGSYEMADPWHDEAGVNERGRVLAMAPGLNPLRVVTVDCQRDGYWCLCRSWDKSGNSRLRGWKHARTREDVEAFVRDFGVSAKFVFLDAGDSDDEFWIWLKRTGWRALRGDQRHEFQWKVMNRNTGKLEEVRRPVSPERTYGASAVHKVPVYYFSNLILKDMLTRLRNRGQWTEATDCGEELKQQMESERRVKKKDGEWEWQQIGSRDNHLWDCSVMQLFPLYMLNVIGPDRTEETQSAPSAPASVDIAP